MPDRVVTQGIESPRAFDSSEDDIIRHLLLLDLPAARAAAERFLSAVLAATERPQRASYIAYDLLCRIDRVVAEHQGLHRAGLSERLSMGERLSCARMDDLRQEFWSAFETLTSRLGALAPESHPAVEQVKNFVQENYSRKIALSEIAHAVKVSRNYLSHLFRRHCGVTVTEFLHRTRMKEAEKLLMEGNRTVSEIAYMVGYQNYRDFHRNFVRHAKTSPKKYRQVRSLSRRPTASLPP